MGIKCSNCSMENEQGVLFCRNCGQKLDMELMESEIRKSMLSKQSKAKTVANIIRRFVKICIVLLVCYLVYGIIDPFGIQIKNVELSDNDAAEAMSVYANIRNNTKGVYAVTADEANYIANKYFLPQDRGLTPVRISIDRRKNLLFSIKKKIYDSIPWGPTFTAFCVPTVLGIPPDDVLLTMKVTGMKIGSIPVPKMLWKYLTKEYLPYYNTKKLRIFCSSVYNLEVDNDKIVIHFNHE